MPDLTTAGSPGVAMELSEVQDDLDLASSISVVQEPIRYHFTLGPERRDRAGSMHGVHACGPEPQIFRGQNGDQYSIVSRLPEVGAFSALWHSRNNGPKAWTDFYTRCRKARMVTCTRTAANDHVCKEVDSNSQELIDAMDGAATALSKERYIVVLRDPRDVAVSTAYWELGLLPAHSRKVELEQEADRRAKEFLLSEVGRIAEASASRFNAFSKLTPRRALFMFYEDLIANPEREYGRLAAVFGVVPNSTVLDKSIRATSFSAMQQAEAEGLLPGINHRGYHRGFQARAKIRWARPGSWMSLLDPEGISEVNRSTIMGLASAPALLHRYFGSDV
ncbi:hypothetical protein CYMTET_22599 [Cymbomonas tetramitiformis]|uniref:Sulfotransferase n=1 Tax=Cymbomonas tetramitiformis TaxID=36881 RepID=A0AAE0L242_9CHLO|nr:hypothetical protein CYMTET_22599 [Cymbomonas tetramitiformis]